MEDVLGVYHRPPDPQAPLVCLDEFCKQLLKETRVPLPARPGALARHDYEYIREGSVSGFMMSLPHEGKRHIWFGPEGRRKGVDFARCLEYLAEELLPEAPRIVLVMDNLNIHKAASLYEIFEPEKALRLWKRFEVHYTPKHGSWLNMAEIEIGLLTRTCLDRRIGSFEEMLTETAAYEAAKNSSPSPINWQFGVDKARVKLRSPYPSVIS